MHSVLGDHDVIAIELKTSKCKIKEKTKLKKIARNSKIMSVS